jgi:hypothetical protein
MGCKKVWPLGYIIYTLPCPQNINIYTRPCKCTSQIFTLSLWKYKYKLFILTQDLQVVYMIVNTYTTWEVTLTWVTSWNNNVEKTHITHLGCHTFVYIGEEVLNLYNHCLPYFSWKGVRMNQIWYEICA